MWKIIGRVLIICLALSCSEQKETNKNKIENPLLGKFDNKFGAAPFDKIKPEHFIPAIEAGIQEGKKEVEAIIDNSEKPSFENTIVALERSGALLSRTNTLLGHLNSAETNSDIQEAARKASPLTSDYYNDLLLNEALFKRVKQVYDQKSTLGLNPEQSTLLENKYRMFANNGALLDSEGKNHLREINKKLSELKIKFGENVLAETNELLVVVEEESRLSGIPEDAIERAKKVATDKQMPESWAFTLHMPSYIAVMTYADDRQLREEMLKTYKSQGNNGNENDNREVVRQLVQLRYEKAKLLGYGNYADMVLEERMADSEEAVIGFLDKLYDLAMPVAQKEKKELAEFMKKEGLNDDVQAWDWSYYSEKLKKSKFDVNDEDLKPYFKLENVLDGIFEISNRLFGISFEKVEGIPVWHEDVMTYEMKDENGKHLALFYADYFPREGKRGGAWMNSIRPQLTGEQGEVRPHVINICSFTPPTEDKPSLLTYREVETLFHEFGHGLHGMLAQGNYASISGTGVYRDFVELPSQLLENWAGEAEALELFAKHYQTGESIPAELVDKIKKSSQFNEGYATIRQLSFGYLDMAWHTLGENESQRMNEFAKDINSVESFENDAMKKTRMFPVIDGDVMSTQFGHLFAGGYAAGYYSYKWAEVLDADAFEQFKKQGIFDQTVADKFKDNVLTKGGSEHPMVLYKRFAGQEPSVDALARRAGFIK